MQKPNPAHPSLLTIAARIVALVVVAVIERLAQGPRPAQRHALPSGATGPRLLPLATKTKCSSLHA